MYCIINLTDELEYRIIKLEAKDHLVCPTLE